MLLSEHFAAEWAELVRGAPLTVEAQLHLSDALAAEDVTALLELYRMARDVETYGTDKFAIRVDRVVGVVAFVEEVSSVLGALENWFAVRLY